MLKLRRNRLLCLLGVCFFLAGIYLFWGITAKNISYNLPRRLWIIAAMFVIAVAISWSTTVFQTITENQILTPSVMGLDSLYLFVQTFIVYFFGSRKLAMMSDMTDFLLSIMVMVGASALLYVAMFRGKQKSVYFLVLIGLVSGQFFRSLSSFMQMRIDPNEFSVVQGKMFASFNNLNTKLVIISAFCIFLLILVSLKDVNKLDVLSLGRDQAISLGVNYTRLVRKQLMIIAVLISVSTALGGPITFFGILVINLSRQLFQTYRHNLLIVGSALFGFAALLIGQIFVERIFNFSTPSNVIINFVGGIYFLYLLLKQNKR